jgi:hypothetical protein
MFVISEAEAAAIRAAFEERGEFAAAIELRRHFPGITDNAQGGNAPASSPAGSHCRCGGVKRMPKTLWLRREH